MAIRKTYKINSIPIKEIIIEERFRTYLGDTEGLAKNIEEIGLLNPITVRRMENGYKLLAGRRRLQACESLGWEKVPARIIGLSDYEWWILQGTSHFDVVCEICDYPITEEHHIIQSGIGGSDEDNNIMNVCPNHHHLLDWMIKILIYLSCPDSPKYSRTKERKYIDMLHKLEIADPEGVLFFNKIIVPKIPSLVNWEGPPPNLEYDGLRQVARVIEEDMSND